MFAQDMPVHKFMCKNERSENKAFWNIWSKYEFYILKSTHSVCLKSLGGFQIKKSSNGSTKVDLVDFSINLGTYQTWTCWQFCLQIKKLAAHLFVELFEIKAQSFFLTKSEQMSHLYLTD